jgi:hypothetical protein
MLAGICFSFVAASESAQRQGRGADQQPWNCQADGNEVLVRVAIG